jgi:perosamine synthetase
MKTDIAFSRPYMMKEEQEAAAAAIASGWIVGGSRLAELERLFAEECRHSIGLGVSSWTTGAFLVLKAWGIGPGDEVIVPSYSFIATANVVTQTGATPVFCDVDPETYNINLAHAEKLVSEKTKAIIPVDQLGMPCDMDAVNALATKHKLHVLQDAACSVGSRYKGRPIGCDAEVVVFSLHARKIVTCGEGGMIVTSDPKLARTLRLLRHHGMTLTDFDRTNSTKPVIEGYELIGYNMRITDIQAAVAVVQFGRIAEMLRLRKLAADTYKKHLEQNSSIILPVEPQDCQGNWQSYMIRLADECPLSIEDVMAGMLQQGVPTRRGVMAAHTEECYLNKNIAVTPPLPVTEHLLRRNLLLPIHPGLTVEQATYVAQSLTEVLASSSKTPASCS